MPNVVIIGGGPSGKHAAEILVKNKDLKVTVINANSFVEWPLAMTHVLCHPEEHDKFVAPNLDTYKVKGADYKIGVVTKVDSEQKQVALKDGSSVAYDALIVATGMDLPLICAGAGITLAERKAEVQKVATSLKAAETVVVAGGGPIGLELVGDLRKAHPSKKILLLCRDGVLSQWPEKTRQLVTQALEAQKIQVISGGGSGGNSEGIPTEAKLEAGTFIAGGAKIAYGAFIPAYSKGPNTQFLQSIGGALDSKGRIVVNEFLQSKTCPEIFAVGVSDVDEPTMFMKLEAQWKCATANVKSLLANKPLAKHSEGMPSAKLPFLLNVGGWTHADFDNAPPPLKICCCGGLGGFPCCPPPCCWPCCSPCMCGYCCGAPTGSGPANALAGMRTTMPGFHLKGWGEAEKAPSQIQMSGRDA